MSDKKISLGEKAEDTMTKAQILNEVAEMFIDKIRNNEEYKDCYSWYACFEQIENDIRKGRRLLNSIDKKIQ